MRVAVERAPACGQYFAHGGMLRELINGVRPRHATVRDLDGFVHHAGRVNARRLEADEALDDQRQRDDGCQNEGLDGPAGRLYDGKQNGSPLQKYCMKKPEIGRAHV